MLDYEKVDKMVENCKKLYPDIPDYCLWVLACDYYLKEGKEEEDNDEETINRKKEALEAYHCQFSCCQLYQLIVTARLNSKICI